VNNQPGHWVRNLRVDPAAVREPVCFPETIDAAVRRVGRDAVDWAVHIGYLMATRCIEAMPDLGGSDHATLSLRLGTESATIRSLIGIDAGSLAGGATPEVVVQMRDCVHRRIGLDRVWHSMRLGHSWLTAYFMAACRDLVEPADQPAQLELISRLLFDFVNPFSIGAGEAYTEEYERWASSAAAARDETVRAVLAGDDIDPHAASSALRYDLDRRHHVGLVVWQDRAAAASDTPMHQVADAMVKALGASNALIMPVGKFELWAWGSSAAKFKPLTELAERVDMSGYVATIGNICTDVTGFRRTHQQALEAARVARLMVNVGHRVIRFDDISLVALLSANIGEAHGFVHRELGELAATGGNTENLRETVLSYLECRRSPRATASRLYIARNTVTYRVKRAEELIGHSLDDREPEIWMALKIAQTLGVSGDTRC
jgi:PucR C-terminal helix-turn-helix domain/GGDEF-like domain